MTREIPGDSEVLYRRTLPGGGLVMIRAHSSPSPLGRDHVHGEVVVERRAEGSRRRGHDAPIVACADAPTVASVMHELFPVAQSNATLAAGCLAHRDLRADAAATP